MTQKLYYRDSYLTEFNAKVIECIAYKDGYAIVFDQTAFYPEGGGQPADKGSLNGIEVKHVFLEENKIYHVIEKILEVGEIVEGKVDFKRRFDYMQQHSGEHIISGIIREQYGYNNVGFHLSENYMTADFDGELSKQDIQKIECKANEVGSKNVPILAKIYSKEEMGKIEYRSKINLEGKVRLVTVEGCDVCACCGTHLTSTGQIGLIKILSSERHRGGTRLTLVCGERALKDYQRKLQSIMEIGTLLSVKPECVTDGVKKIQSELGEAKQKLAERTKELFGYKATHYAASYSQLICKVEEGLSPDELRRLCLATTEKVGVLCIILTSDKNQLKYAMGANQVDVRPVCKALNTAFQGRGGGSKEMCQGSLEGMPGEVEQFIGAYLEKYPIS